MIYLPHTSEDIASMLGAVGLKHLDDLFSTVPEDCRCKEDPSTRCLLGLAVTNILFLPPYLTS